MHQLRNRDINRHAERVVIGGDRFVNSSHFDGSLTMTDMKPLKRSLKQIAMPTVAATSEPQLMALRRHGADRHLPSTVRIAAPASAMVHL